MEKEKLSRIALVGMMTASIAAGAAIVANAETAMEKCYGVAKAGKNDCADKTGKHSCAGHSKEDGSDDNWIYTPKGLCDRLVNGKTE